MATYYKRLIKESKVPTYYGNNVLHKDKNRILISWKESDNKYRVVFADLTRKTISAEELSEFEEASQPTK